MRTFARSARQARTEVTLRNGINLTDHPEPRGSRRPGRRPHVPSSKPTMSKSRRASSPGSIGSGHRLYRPRRGTKTSPTPLGPPPFAGGPYMCEPPMRQRLFAILLLGPFCARSRPARAAPGVRSIWDRGAGYSRSWPLKPAHFSRPPRVPNANSCGQPDAQAAEPLSSVTRSECRCASPRLPARCGPCGALRDRRSRRFRSAHRRQRSAGGGSGAESSSPAQRAQGSRPRR